jgi:hypothetical protein
MKLERVELRAPAESLDVVDDRIGDDAVRRLRPGLVAMQAGGRARRDVLLKEALATSAVVEALEGQRPSRNPRQHPVGGRLVVGEEVGLPEPALGPQQLVGVGELERHLNQSPGSAEKQPTPRRH